MTSTTARKLAPGIRALLPLPIGWVAKAQRDPIEFLLHGWRTFGEVFR